MNLIFKTINHSTLTVIFFLASLNCLGQKDFTPDWSKGVVWYQIFPERFNNGDLRKAVRQVSIPAMDLVVLSN